MHNIQDIISPSAEGDHKFSWSRGKPVHVSGFWIFEDHPSQLIESCLLDQVDIVLDKQSHPLHIDSLSRQTRKHLFLNIGDHFPDLRIIFDFIVSLNSVQNPLDYWTVLDGFFS